MLKALPDTAPMDPKRIAEAVSAAVDKAPKPESFITAPPAAAEPVRNNAAGGEEVKSNNGFMVTDETPAEEN